VDLTDGDVHVALRGYREDPIPPLSPPGFPLDRCVRESLEDLGAPLLYCLRRHGHGCNRDDRVVRILLNSARNVTEDRPSAQVNLCDTFHGPISIVTLVLRMC
jgi:hypothetical protein